MRQFFPAIKSQIYRLLPTPARIQGIPNYSKNLYLDVLDLVAGRTPQDEPPRRLNIAGEGSFQALGEHNVALCRDYGRLSPDDDVFDLGCGIGRTAMAMKSFLRPTASYVGLDTIRFAIRWCRRSISTTHKNFRFVHADLFNLMYNPRGKVDPSTYAFPFSEASFSFCIATSVFTHLLPATMERYIQEITRLLRVEGSFTSTWFLLCPETNAALQNKGTKNPFPHQFSKHSQRSLHAPEQAVAYDLDYVRNLFTRAGLEIRAVYFGGWSGISSAIDSGQDLIVATRLSIPGDP